MPLNRTLVVLLEPGEEIWVQKRDGIFEVGVQLEEDSFTWLELNRAQLELHRDHINEALSY